jgi:hypothetical protein
MKIITLIPMLLVEHDYNEENPRLLVVDDNNTEDLRLLVGEVNNKEDLCTAADGRVSYTDELSLLVEALVEEDNYTQDLNR